MSSAEVCDIIADMKKLIVGIVSLGCALQAVALADTREVSATKDVDVLVVGGTVKGVVAALEAKAKGAEKVQLVTSFPYLGEDMAGTLELTLPAGMDLSSPLLRKMWSGKCGYAPFDYWPDHHTPHPRYVFKNDWWERLSETSLPHSPTDAVYYEDDVGYRCVLRSDAAISAVEVTVLENEGARTAGVDGSVVAGTGAGTALAFVRKDATVPIRGDGNYRDAAAVTWTAPVVGPLKEVKLVVRKAPASKSQLVARIGFRLRDAEATFTSPSPLKVKQVLDRALVDVGVDFLTMTAVRRVMRDAAGKVVGVETVNRSGRTLYRARRIVDASRFGVLSADARYAEGAEADFSRVVIADGPAPAAAGMSVERLEGEFEISHMSQAVKGLAYRCRMKLPMSGWRYPALAAAEWEARDRTWVSGTLDDAGLLVPVRDARTVAGEKAADGIPCWGAFDVVVVGGGTSGSPTAIAAARAGAKVLLVEYLDVLGGTGTDGMILGYYDGNHCGFTEEFKRANKEIGGRFGLYRRAETWRQMCRQAGVTVWLGAMGTGALVEDGQVKGLEISTELGTGVVRAKCVVDSTGNADVAAAAGAGTWFLPPGELALQSAGQAPHRLGRGCINSDFGYLDDSSAEDLWLFGVRARAGAPDAWDIAKMPDSRERRRIVPDLLLNAQDVTARRSFPDTVVQAFSRQDSHGYLVDDFRFVSAPSAQLHAAGKEKRWKFSVNVPLRSLLPKGVKGLAVTGISTGCARDVLPIIRMQADLMNMGYGVGVAAAMAAKKDGDFRAIDCAALRRALVEKGILREEALAWEKDVDVSSDAVVAAAVRTMGKDLRGSDVVWRPENRARALPLLRTAYAAAGTAVERQNYALALGLLGDPTGVETLVGIVTGKIAIEPVDRKGAFGTGGNAGAPGSPETKAGFLLALGRTKAKAAVDPILRRLEEIRPGMALKSLRPVLLAAEALGDPAAAPILAKCLKMDGYHGFAVKSAKDLAPLGGYGPGPEMLECLKEIGFARTLWACGDCDGLAQRTLEDYAKDPRGPLAAHAKAVLSVRPATASAVKKKLSRPFAPFRASKGIQDPNGGV